MINLKGKNILIMGAAGRLGFAIVQKCLEYDCKNVFLSDFNEADLISKSKKINVKKFQRIHLIKSDITNEKEIIDLLEKCKKLVPIIDGAVQCAYPRSAGWGTKIENLRQEDLQEDLNSQLGGSIIFSKHIMKLFVDQKRGSLVHISSIMGINAPKFYNYEGTEMHSPIEYTAIKAAIIAITKWLAKYYFNKGVRVNCVSPGGILDKQNQKFLDKYRLSCNNIGMLNSSDLSDAIVFLLSDVSRAVTGQNLIIDDGWSL
ncbi:oxidoreductase [Prochlorococcus marinus]|uniref:oxidoreductase n=1 Tax=Prochlorococcus marinus TaxID=1219 RepID=UPI0039B0949E